MILVGELRDQETISLALTPAETCHLVFGTLHTSSAAKPLTGLWMFSGQRQRHGAFHAVGIAACGYCAKAPKTRRGGRVACHEIMLKTPAIRNLIREDKVAQMYSIIQTGAAHGM